LNQANQFQNPVFYRNSSSTRDAHSPEPA